MKTSSINGIKASYYSFSIPFILLTITNLSLIMNLSFESHFELTPQEQCNIQMVGRWGGVFSTTQYFLCFIIFRYLIQQKHNTYAMLCVRGGIQILYLLSKFAKQLNIQFFYG